MAKNLGISDYVKEKLTAINDSTAIPLRVLVKDIVEKFPSVKDETSASVRINAVLKQKAVALTYGRLKGKDGKTYIVLASQVPPKDAEIVTTTETEVLNATETLSAQQSTRFDSVGEDSAEGTNEDSIPVSH